MRKCAVKNCPNSDQTVLCHRFPKNRNIAQKWQNALNLCHVPLDTLMSKFIICYMHFNCQDYRNIESNCLNSNAIPQLRPTNPRNCPVVQREHRVFWELSLEKEELISPYNLIGNCLASPQESNDTCCLPKEQNAADSLIQSTDGSGFTMLDADASCSFLTDSNIDVPDCRKDLKLGNESDSGNSHDLHPDSTDSDVEVLACEGMYESSETDISASILKLEHTDTDGESDVLSKTNDLIDVEYDHLDKQQLIDLAKQQSKDIEELKSKLEILKSAQKTLIGHFQVFRETIAEEDNLQS